MNHKTMPPEPHDPLLQRYQEANALDDARPSPALRERVLAQARAQAERQIQKPASARPLAANDSVWTLRALGSLAVLSLVGLLALQFDRGTPEEREVAFGPTPSPSVPADAATPAAPETSIAPSAAPGAVAPAPRPKTAPAHPAAKATARPAAETDAPTTATERQAAEASVVRAPEPFPAPAVAPSNEKAVAPALASRQRTPAAPAADHAADTEAVARLGESEAPARSADMVARSARSGPAAGQASLAPPLLVATARGDAEAVRALLAQGADVNSHDATGRTALMLAALRGDVGLVRLLLGAGADPQGRNPQGLTAADLARAAGHGAVLELLEPAPAR